MWQYEQPDLWQSSEWNPQFQIRYWLLQVQLSSTWNQSGWYLWWCFPFFNFDWNHSHNRKTDLFRFGPQVFLWPPVTNYMLLYSTLLCKKIACAPGGHKKFMLTKLGGRNRIDPKKTFAIIKDKITGFWSVYTLYRNATPKMTLAHFVLAEIGYVQLQFSD